MDDMLEKLGETIAGALPGSITSHSVANGELTIHAPGGYATAAPVPMASLPR